MARITIVTAWLAVGLVFGLLAFLVALFTTWVLCGPILSEHIYSGQRSYLRSMRIVIEEFHKARGRFPLTLNELKEWKPDWRWTINKDGLISSGIWEQPIVYRYDESNPVLISYGWDNQPGGVGLNSDITSESDYADSNSRRHLMTFWQYARYPRLHYFVIVSLVAGAIGSLLFLGLVRPSHLSQHARLPLLRLLACLAVISVLTYVVTYAILMGK